jgi:hypothetical protein
MGHRAAQVGGLFYTGVASGPCGEIDLESSYPFNLLLTDLSTYALFLFAAPTGMG